MTGVLKDESAGVGYGQRAMRSDGSASTPRGGHVVARVAGRACCLQMYLCSADDGCLKLIVRIGRASFSPAA